MEQYHRQLTVTPSLSSSGGRKIDDESPAHFFAGSYLNPDAEPYKSSEAYIFGKAAHHLYTGEANFNEHFIEQLDKAPDGRDWHHANLSCKKWLGEQALAGREVLKPSSIVHIGGMAHSLAAHPAVQEGLLNGLVEHSIVWKDKVTGVWLKARPDNIPLESDMVADIKTTTDASHHACMRSMTDYGYHCQLAFIHEGILATTGRTMSDYFLVFVEKSPPYAVAVKLVDWTAIEYGRRQMRRAINRFADCLEKGEWPAYEDDDRPLGLMPWRAKQLADEAEAKTLPGFYDPPYRPAETRHREVSEAN